MGVRIKNPKETLWIAGPLLFVLLVRMVREYATRLNPAFNWPPVLLGNAFLAIGWGLGYFLAEADHVFYATMCDPQDETCRLVKEEWERKNWRNAWGILERTKGERKRLPIRNMLTIFILLGVGIWVVSSSGSMLASGMVMGLLVRLFSEAVRDAEYKKWYWVFARDFTPMEHRGFLTAWGLVLLFSLVLLMRGF